MSLNRTVILAFAVVMLCVAVKAMLTFEEDRARLERQFEEREAVLTEDRAALELERDLAHRAIEKERRSAQQDLVRIRAEIALERRTLRNLRSKNEE